MTFERLQIVFVGVFISAAAGAQPTSTSAPTFDVVSIRTVPPNAPSILRSQDFTAILPGGQYVDSRAALLFMIAFAYDVKNGMHIEGLPNWAKSQDFAVAAKAAQDFPALSPAENREQVRLMMRTMLADRFKLRLHPETRQERKFGLHAAKDGLKLAEVEAPAPPAKEGYVNAAIGDSDGRMIGIKSTMKGMAAALTIFMGHPVIDETGLKGYYTFDVRWSAPEKTEGQSGGLGVEGRALLVSMLQEKFGLYLTNSTGPVEYWVIDHIEPPTPN